MLKRIAMLLLALLLLAGCTASEPDDVPDVTAYVGENWSDLTPCTYDGDTLTMTLHSALSYDSACAHGESVYSGELSLIGYLENVQMIALEIATACELESLNVTLNALSSDGKIIFTVKSSGDFWTCWS